MAQVLEAMAQGMDGFERRVAIKRLLPQHATDQKRRRQGIGRRVADALVDALHRRGITEIELQATEDGEGIYRSLGFTSPPNRTPLTLSTDADNPLD